MLKLPTNDAWYFLYITVGLKVTKRGDSINKLSLKRGDSINKLSLKRGDSISKLSLKRGDLISKLTLKKDYQS